MRGLSVDSGDIGFTQSTLRARIFFIVRHAHPLQCIPGFGAKEAVQICQTQEIPASAWSFGPCNIFAILRKYVTLSRCKSVTVAM
jgi:hypothetical protein